MTSEEIEKAAQVESDKLFFYCSKDDFKRGFIKGFELSDKHWQEKTRWIPVDEKLPPRGDETRQIFVKNENKHSLSWMIVSCFDEDYFDDIEFIKRVFTHWKEID